MFEQVLTVRQVTRAINGGEKENGIILEDITKNPPFRLFMTADEAIWAGKELVKQGKQLRRKERK